MEEGTLPQPGLATASDYEAAVDNCLRRVTELRQHMARNQEEIDRLRVETKKLIAELKAA